MKRKLQVSLDTVFYDGYHYTTLDFVGPDASCYDEMLCAALRIWRKLPSDWEVAPNDTCIVEQVIAKHAWSCDSICVFSQCHNLSFAYGTSKHALPGQEIYNAVLEIRNGSYRVNMSATSRILIRKKAEAILSKPDSLGEKLWKKLKFTDFVVACGEEIPCHRAVLAEASPVLAAAVESTMREGREGRLEIKDVEASAVKAMLQYMYTGEVNCDANALASALLLADRYDVKGLFQAVQEQILEKLDASNIFSISKVLKPLKESLVVKPVWDALRERIKSDDSLMDAMMG
eukprot:TRINITY_DN109129_c0_g1_i1.p1 TRINITY_DN109129_c0_g1~~TRINITY_DN109129_c0_g1_i1.p1  ORF type:complete len:312 (-),score=57.51 TRINITY_DN109129_c0_g1_i1:160-1026(-)